MKLYFWDWNSSLTIEKCDDMDFPFLNNDDARKNKCFTNLESARLAAKIDLRHRIEELSEALLALDSIGPDNVKTVKHIKGAFDVSGDAMNRCIDENTRLRVAMAKAAQRAEDWPDSNDDPADVLADCVNILYAALDIDA